MKVELAAFVLSANLTLEVTGQLYNETNTFINVTLRDDKYKTAEVMTSDNIRSGILSRSDGTVEELPLLSEALQNLIDNISGKEIMFGERKVRVPQLVLNKATTITYR